MSNIFNLTLYTYIYYLICSCSEAQKHFVMNICHRVALHMYRVSTYIISHLPKYHIRVYLRYCNTKA